MNFFQKELRRFFDNRPEFENASYIGRACYVPLDRGLRLKAQFIEQGYANHYYALRLQVINDEQNVDNLVLNFKDFWNTNSQKYIWDSGETCWYCGSPTRNEIDSLVDDVCEFVSVYNAMSQSDDIDFGGM